MGRLSGTETRSIEVLRYVPLRRLTFVERETAGETRIGKFKRRSRYREAYSILGKVAHAVTRAGVTFSVSQPLGIDDDDALYYQSCLPGEPVPDLISETNGASLMSDIGRVHAEVHRLEPWSDLPTLSNASLLARAERDLALISFYVGDVGEALAPYAALLRKACPGEDMTAVCHGDFVASQLLRDSGGVYSVIDFDLVTLADPYHDLSIFLASLDYDVPGSKLIVTVRGKNGSARTTCGIQGAARRTDRSSPARVASHGGGDLLSGADAEKGPLRDGKRAPPTRLCSNLAEDLG